MLMPLRLSMLQDYNKGVNRTMELNYKLTEQDYVDFNLFHAKNSKTVKKSMMVQQVSGPVIYLLLAFIISMMLELSFISLFIPALIMSILWFFLYPAYFFRLIKSNASKMLREGKNEGVLGPHTMIFTEEGLREISPRGDLTVSWSGIENVGEDPSGFYLYNSGMTALIIPKKDLENSSAVGEFLAGKIA